MTDVDHSFATSGLTVGDFDALLRTLYRSIVEPVPWTPWLDALRSLLGANYVTLMLRPPTPDRRWLVVFSGEARPDIVPSYETFFYATDPFMNLPPNRMLMVGELIDEDEWLNSAIHREFLRPLDVRHYMGADLQSGSDVLCRLRVSRSAQASAFGERERAICELLLPHLERAVQARALRDNVDAERRVYAGTLERLAVGALTLDRQAQVLNLNHAASEILGARDGIGLAQRRLQATKGLENRELTTLIEQAIAGSDQEGHDVAAAMSITRPSGRSKLGILVRTVPLSEWSESPVRAAAFVVLRDPETKFNASQSVLKRLYGLTPAESNLTVKLLDGLSVEEAAEALAISRHTARSQLRAIFAKTGVTRQTELMRKLLRGVIPLQ